MGLYLVYIWLLCIAAGIGWLILLALICCEWPAREVEGE